MQIVAAILFLAVFALGLSALVSIFALGFLVLGIVVGIALAETGL